jgi:uncharacterized membrane protein
MGIGMNPLLLIFTIFIVFFVIPIILIMLLARFFIRSIVIYVKEVLREEDEKRTTGTPVKSRHQSNMLDM